MTSYIPPFNFEGQQVWIIDRNGVSWWFLVEVCRVLKIGNPSQAATRLDDDEKSTITKDDSRKINGLRFV